jgi:hypothetical protein
MNAIRFLTTVAKSVHHELFRNEDVLKQVPFHAVSPACTSQLAQGAAQCRSRPHAVCSPNVILEGVKRCPTWDAAGVREDRDPQHAAAGGCGGAV